MALKEVGTILSNEPIIDNMIYKMEVQSDKIAEAILPGQFLQIKCGESPLLRKPISIFDCNKEKGTYSILYQVRGLGTQKLSMKKPAETLDIIGPLGTSFPLPKRKGEIFLVGGGIGIAPLFLLGKTLRDHGLPYTFILGFSTQAESYAIDIFESLAPVKVATMDGSLGTKGHVGAILEAYSKDQIGVIYACGPEPMAKYLQQYSQDSEVYLSLEAYMGCGVGACLSCVCKTKNQDYLRVCTEGPVVKGEEVDLS